MESERNADPAGDVHQHPQDNESDQLKSPGQSAASAPRWMATSTMPVAQLPVREPNSASSYTIFDGRNVEIELAVTQGPGVRVFARLIAFAGRGA